MDYCDDWKLLAAYARERSQKAFARVVAKYADMVFHTALRRTKRHDLAEDVTQAVFIVLARGAGGMRQSGSLAAWLHQTTLHAAASALRAELRRRKHERSATEEAPVARSNSEAPVEVADQVEHALHRLPKADREILAIHYLEGLTMTQTANRLGIGDETARKRLSRALGKLRMRLKGRGGEAVGIAVISTALGAMSAPSPSIAVAGQIASTVTAGGNRGTAFQLAGQIIRHMRLIMLARAAAMTGVFLLLVAAVGIGLAQRNGTTDLTEQLPGTVPPTTLPQAAVELPAAIRQALARNAEQLNPITVEWTQTGSSRLSVPEAAKVMKLDNRMADSMINSRKKFYVAYRDGKYATWYEEEPRQSIYQPDQESGRLAEVSFDGNFFYNALDHNGRWGGMVIKEDISASAGASEEAPRLDTGLFDIVGLPLSVRTVDLRRQAPPRSRLLSLLEQGANVVDVRTVEVNGRELRFVRLITDDPDRKFAESQKVDDVVADLSRSDGNRQFIQSIPERRRLPENRLYDFYLDPQLNYAVRRYEVRYEGGILLSRIDCDEFERLAGRDVFLARISIQSYYTGSNIPGTYFKEPLFTRTYQVTKLEVEPPGEFSFSFAKFIVPGVRILEKIDGKSTIYILEEDGTKRPDK